MLNLDGVSNEELLVLLRERILREQRDEPCYELGRALVGVQSALEFLRMRVVGINAGDMAVRPSRAPRH